MSGNNMSYADTGVYGSNGVGVTRNPSIGAAAYLSGSDGPASLDRNRSLGGTRAFDVEPDAELMEMTGQKTGGSGSGKNL